MPSPFGTGEVVTRLRRLLDLRGMFAMQVDETLVPTVLVGDGTASPARGSGRRWHINQTVNVLVNNFVEVINLSGFDQKIDRIYIRLSETTGIGSLPTLLTATVKVGPTLSVAVTQARTTERNPLPAGGGVNDVGVVVGIGSTEGTGDPTADVFVADVGAQIDQNLAVLGGNTARWQSIIQLTTLDVILPPRSSCFIRCPQLPLASTAFAATVSGFFFDDVPRLGTF